MKRTILFFAILMALFSGSLKAQNALDFDGTDDKVDCGNDTSVQIKGKFITLEAWIYPTAWKTNAYDGNVICKEYNTSNYGYMLRCGAGGKLNFAIGDGSWHEITTTGTVLSLNTWQHVAGTYDGVKMRLYLNGSPIDSLTVAATISVTSSTNLILGGHSSYTRFYQGKIDEVRIWSIWRSTADIQGSMNSEICSKMNGLRAAYKFNQGKAGSVNTNVKTLTDVSGYANTGSLTAFSLSGSNSNWVSGKTLTRAVSNGKDSVVRCDRYTSPSGKYKWTVSGTYKDTIPTVMGCDSAISIKLTIKKSTSKTITVYACKSYTSPSGIYTWTQTGIYTDYLINAAKCDSVITIKLFIGGSRDTIEAADCKSYKVPSGKRILTASGEYYDTLVNFRGCDSIILIRFSILPETYGSLDTTYCHSFTSPSKRHIWTKEGNYFDTIANHNGCDSIITVTLKNLVSYASFKKSACEKFRSPKGHIWTSTGRYYDTLVNEAGCDSIVTFDVTIRKATTGSISPTVCRVYTSPGRKRRYYSSTTIKDTLVNAAGCDSFLTINLTVINPDVAVSQNGATLTAQSASGTFQWLNCTLLMMPVSGQNAAVFKPSVNGTYAVEVTENSCKDTSECYTVSGVSVQQPGLAAQWMIVPNPNDGTGRFLLASSLEQANICLRDMAGRVVFESTGSNPVFSMHILPGIYVAEVRLGNEVSRQKMLVR